MERDLEVWLGMERDLEVWMFKKNSRCFRYMRPLDHYQKNCLDVTSKALIATPDCLYHSLSKELSLLASLQPYLTIWSLWMLPGLFMPHNFVSSGQAQVDKLSWACLSVTPVYLLALISHPISSHCEIHCVRERLSHKPSYWCYLTLTRMNILSSKTLSGQTPTLPMLI